VPLRQKTQEDDSTSPDVDGARLALVVEESLGRHVTLGARPVLYFHGLLQVDDLLHVWVVSHRRVPRVPVLVHLDLRESKVNQKSSAGRRVVEEVGRLDVAMHYAELCQATHRREQRPHVVLYFSQVQLRQVCQVRLALLEPKH